MGMNSRLRKQLLKYLKKDNKDNLLTPKNHHQFPQNQQPLNKNPLGGNRKSKSI